jgi:hypothetical protein
MPRIKTITIAMWAIFVIAVAILSVIVEFKSLALCIHNQPIKGTITETFPNNHLGLDFNYVVDGHVFNGSRYAGQIGRTFDTIKLGDSVTVFYNEKNPASSTLDNPSVLLVRIIGQIVAACAILPVLGIYFSQRYGFLPNKKN